MTTKKINNKIQFPELGKSVIALVVTLIGVSPDIAWSDDVPSPPGRDPVRTDEVLGAAVSQGFKYDSNVFRLNDDRDTPATSAAGQKSDFISVTGIRLGFDKHFGRHHLFLLAAPSIVRYAQFDQLNYVGQDFLADWTGRLGTDGHYGLNYEHTKVATDPADQLVPTGNTATKDQFGADLAIPTGPRWQVVTAWRADKTRNSSETERGGDNEGWAADGGLRFLPASGNNIDLRYRRSHYNYSNVIASSLADNTYTQDEVELSGNWQLNEPSRFEGRTSYVQRRHANVADRDFSGWVGSIKYIWKPSVATATSVRIFRDLGAVTDASASYARSYGISVQPTWQASTKLAFGSLVEWRHRSYNGFALTSRAPEQTGKVGVNARYEPTRNWQLGISISDERRRSTDSSHEYSDVISSLTAQWKM